MHTLWTVGGIAAFVWVWLWLYRRVKKPLIMWIGLFVLVGIAGYVYLVIDSSPELTITGDPKGVQFYDVWDKAYHVHHHGIKYPDGTFTKQSDTPETASDKLKR
jgi:hypothetical protein